jgi:membrane-bound inhibitor of C-type lysozyme
MASDPRVLLGLVWSAALLTACGGSPAPGRAGLAPAGVVRYECGGGRYVFEARIEGETAVLRLPGRTVTLLRVPAGSGTKYAAEDVSFWSKGTEALLEVDSAVYLGCRGARSE